MKQLLFLLIGFSFISMIPPHEFYVSITELNLKNDTLQVAIKVFTHDFEEVLKDELSESIFLDHSTDMGQAFRAIRNYSEPRVEISGAGKRWPLTWVGHEYVEDVTWIYAYAIVDKNASIMFVKTTLLSSHFHDQHNMIHFKTGEKTQSKLCTKSEPEVRFPLSLD